MMRDRQCDELQTRGANNMTDAMRDLAAEELEKVSGGTFAFPPRPEIIIMPPPPPDFPTYTGPIWC
jgi:hypothetical protein